MPPLPSLAITSMLRVPTWSLSGVPLKVRVKESKLSQVGKAPPPDSWALYVRVSPTSTSANALAANWKLKPASSVAFWLGTGLATVGATLLPVTTMPLPNRSAIRTTASAPEFQSSSIPRL